MKNPTSTKRSGKFVKNRFHCPRIVRKMFVKKAKTGIRMPTLLTEAMVFSQPGVGVCSRWWSPTAV